MPPEQARVCRRKSDGASNDVMVLRLKQRCDSRQTITTKSVKAQTGRDVSDGVSEKVIAQ